MWEAIGSVLTNENAIAVLAFIMAAVLVVAFFAKIGLINVRTKSVRIGKDEKERAIIRRQIEWAHVYIMSLESKLIGNKKDDYFAKYILERVYDEVVKWVTFNHVATTGMYVEIKQEEVCALVYSFNINDEYKTQEFKKRMCNWTREVIERLVQIRELYQ
ncbi:MAG: hypothetical protein J6N15_00140 [Ruminiclostridium sp.]|nr:hypothetical protein [Ruminiclostridium sp.]